MKKDYPDIQALENEKWQDPDPAAGKLGTRVPAKWLQNTEDSIKSLTNEMLEVLKEAGINADELNNTQLLAALKKIISEATAEPVGKLHFIDDKVIPNGMIEYAGQTIDRAKMPKLYEKYGERMPNYRDRYPRAANGPLGGKAGEIQEDAVQNAQASFSIRRAGWADSDEDVVFDIVGFNLERTQTAKRIDVKANLSPNSTDKVTLDLKNIMRTATETRVKSFFTLICTKIQ